MQPPTDQRFYRGSDRIIGGVCSGLAEGFHLDPIWVRLAFVVLAFAQGIGLVAYLVLWVIMPERTQDRPAGRSSFDSMANDIRRAWADLRAQLGGRPSPGAPTYATTSPPPPQVAVDANAPAPSPAGQIPPPPATAIPTATPRSGVHNQSLVLGVILVLIGLAFLASNAGLVNWSEIWPIALIALGVVLLARNLEKRA
jgi:phage shock protein C